MEFSACDILLGTVSPTQSTRLIRPLLPNVPLQPEAGKLIPIPWVHKNPHQLPKSIISNVLSNRYGPRSFTHDPGYGNIKGPTIIRSTLNIIDKFK